MLFYLFYGLAGKSIHPAIIPEPKKERKTKKADKDIHVGDLFASLIPQPVKKSKWKTLQLLFQSIIAVVFDNKVLTMYFD